MVYDERFDGLSDPPWMVMVWTQRSVSLYAISWVKNWPPLIVPSEFSNHVVDLVPSIVMYSGRRALLYTHMSWRQLRWTT
jgi:hypothetical protein